MACLNAWRPSVPDSEREVVEVLPDLTKLSDAELKELISRLEKEEDEISYRRRLLHGKIDILRAELVARLKQKGEGELAQVDVDRLSEILSGKAAPQGLES
jgi:hypothetical protein